MATLVTAEALLEELRAASWGAAQRDLGEVQAFALAHGFDQELRHWDMTFWAERLREERYAITDEELRPYFALPAVLDGLFGVRISRGSPPPGGAVHACICMNEVGNCSVAIQ